MASIGCDNNMGKTDGRRECAVSQTIPETEFGLGICDSTYCPKTWSGMGKLFQQETLSDVMLMAEGQSIPCHKFLLAAASEYFYNRLEVETETGILLQIEGITFNALKVIVSYFYTGYINITEENIKDVMPACKTLNLASASAICDAFASEMINPGNCIGLYKMAMAHDFQDLSVKALLIMQKNFSAVLSGREFFAISETDLVGYIQNWNLNSLNNDLVFEAVKMWVRYQPLERESSFSRLITHLRLRYCSHHYLTHVISKEPLMDNRECQKILLDALVHHTNIFPDSSEQADTVPRKRSTKRNKLIILGGVSDPGHVIHTDVWSLRGAGWRVMEQSSIPASIYSFSACVVKGGVLVTGGYSDDDKPISQCWLLSTTTYQWSSLPDLRTPRARHASVCVAGDVYVIAGEGGDGKEISCMEYLGKIGKTWDPLPDLPKALIHTMAVSYGQHIYVFGGTDMAGEPSRSVFAYGTNSRIWQALTEMPQICKFGSAVVWKDRIYIVGGFDQSCMCYYPALAQWSTLSRSGYAHADAAALAWQGRILLCGGRINEVCDDDAADATCTSLIEEYDPATDTWVVSQLELPHTLCLHFAFSTESDVTHTTSGDRADKSRTRQPFIIGDATIDGLHGVTTLDGTLVAIHVGSGATFNEISQELDHAEITKGVGKMFLVCGLREAGTEQCFGEIMVNLVALISKAKDRCCSLKVSSVLPSAKPNDRINQLNDLIRDVCKRLGVGFVDNNRNFLLRDNTRDQSAFLGNTDRLTAKGILRLMGNMGLAIPFLHNATQW